MLVKGKKWENRVCFFYIVCFSIGDVKNGYF